MITFYATTPHRYTFREFRNGLPEEQAAATRRLGYSRLELGEPPAPGLHILTDFERLLAPERALATRLYRRLQKRPDVRVLGDPSRWQDRHQLLTRLADEGINDFRSYTVDQLGPDVRFPVFLRWANEHGGSLGGPIADRATLDRRLKRIMRDHHRRMRWIRDQLLIVEQLDARSPDGLYRKYSVFRVGDEFMARHMIVGKNWVTKYAKVVTPELVSEEDAFLADPPDLDLIERVFDLAGIEFGRIDYGYIDGRPQIWEINTNPMLVPGKPPHELRQANQGRVFDAIRASVVRQVPAASASPSRAPLIAAPERWGWNAVNRASRRLDPKRS